jgi:hypothetical protein
MKKDSDVRNAPPYNKCILGEQIRLSSYAKNTERPTSNPYHIAFLQ